MRRLRQTSPARNPGPSRPEPSAPRRSSPDCAPHRLSPSPDWLARTRPENAPAPRPGEAPAPSRLPPTRRPCGIAATPSPRAPVPSSDNTAPARRSSQPVEMAPRTGGNARSRPVPPTPRHEPARRIRHEIQDIRRSAMQPRRPDPLADNGPNRQMQSNLSARRRSVVPPPTRPAMPPKNQRQCRRNQQKVVEMPAEKRRRDPWLQPPPVQRIQSTRALEQPVLPIGECPHSSATITSPAPTAKIILSRITTSRH